MQAGEEFCSECAAVIFETEELAMNKPIQKQPKPEPKRKKKMPSDKDYLAALGPCGK